MTELEGEGEDRIEFRHFDRDLGVLVAELDSGVDYHPAQLKEGRITGDDARIRSFLPVQDRETGLVRQYASRIHDRSNEQGGGKAVYTLGHNQSHYHWEEVSSDISQPWLHYGFVQPLILSEVVISQRYWVGGIFHIEARDFHTGQWVDVFLVDEPSMAEDVTNARSNVTPPLQDTSVLTNELRIHIFTGGQWRDRFESRGWCCEVYWVQMAGRLPHTQEDAVERKEFVLDSLDDLTVCDCRVQIEGLYEPISIPAALILPGSDRLDELLPIVQARGIVEISEAELGIHQEDERAMEVVQANPSLVDAETLISFLVWTGTKPEASADVLVELYAFFAALKMRSAMYCVCETIVSRPHNEILHVLPQVYFRFEHPLHVSSDPQCEFRSPLVQVVCQKAETVPRKLVMAEGLSPLLAEVLKTCGPVAAGIPASVLLMSHPSIHLDHAVSRRNAELANLEVLSERGILQDVTLVSSLDKMTRRANWIVLLLRSSFFKTMFSFDGAEKEAFLESRTVTLDCLSVGGLDAFLHFLYRAKIPSELPLKDLVQLARRAEMFNERYLLSLCLTVLCDLPLKGLLKKLRRSNVEILEECGFFERVVATWIARGTKSLWRRKVTKGAIMRAIQKQ